MSAKREKSLRPVRKSLAARLAAAVRLAQGRYFDEKGGTR
jgi:hypothetical protein